MTSFTKSAQFPFSGWLPKAIRAPTPVRSLVHSRTLVTAGLFLLINFRFSFKISLGLCFLIFFGLFTIRISRVLAIYEKDFKKIVALSTLSQIGFCIFTLGLGYTFLTLFHLIRHALFKSCLFMLVGFRIYSFWGQQDIRRYTRFKKLRAFIHFQLLICLFCLCGLFFTRGLVRKDFILEFFFIQ